MNPVLGHLLLAVATPTPSPLPYNPDDVTPGVIGFAFTFIIFLLVGLIAWDMLRRVRRVRYREEVRAKLEAEIAAGRGGTDGAGTTGQPKGDMDAPGPGAPDDPGRR